MKTVHSNPNLTNRHSVLLSELQVPTTPWSLNPHKPVGPLSIDVINAPAANTILYSDQKQTSFEHWQM